MVPLSPQASCRYVAHVAHVARIDWRELDDFLPPLREWLGKRCRDGGEADDVAQDTLLRAARCRHALQDPDRLWPWLLTIAGNLLRDRGRRSARWRRPEPGEELDELQDPESACSGAGELWIGDRFVDRETALELLGEELERLGSRDRTLLACYYQDGLSCRETAGVVDVTYELVKVHLFRARRRLARAVRRRLLVLEIPRAPSLPSAIAAGLGVEPDVAHAPAACLVAEVP